MIWRLSRFFLFQLLGGLLGYWLLPMPDTLHRVLLGALLASVAWVLLDLNRSRKLLDWLRDADPRQSPAIAGLWGEVAQRMHRLLRTRERQALESENRLQEFLAAIQASPNGIVLLDASGRIEWCNQTAAGHFGFDPQRDLLQHVGNLVRDPLFAAYQAKADFSQDVVLPAPTSTSTRPVRLSVQMHPYGQGHKLLISRDVTAVEQAEAMRRDFVANVSHEIRTPLTVLAGFVETLQTLPLDAGERQRYLGLMSQQAHRMQTLVSDLLTLSRLEGSLPPGMEEWVDVRALVTQCEQEGRDLSMLMAHMGHMLSVHIEGDCALAGSQSELQSAMSNIVNNAIRYTPTGGTVRLVWRVLDDGRGEFTVSDSGPGIAPEHLPRLTERFYRVDRSRSRETGGTGLGLAIVKHVVQRHGGQLRIHSVPGQGSSFSIEFPASRVRPIHVPAGNATAQPA